MGAVFLLVFLPLIAALGFMLKTAQGEASGGALLAAGMFLFLSVVIGVGAMRLAHKWDEDGANR